MDPTAVVMEAIGWRNSWSDVFRSSDRNFIVYVRSCNIDKSLPCRPRWAPLRLSSWEGLEVPEVVTWEGAQRIHWEKWAARQVRCSRPQNVVFDAGSMTDSISALPCNTNVPRLVHRHIACPGDSIINRLTLCQWNIISKRCLIIYIDVLDCLDSFMICYG